MLKAKYKSQYRKKGDGKLVFVYTVTGDKKDLDQYKKDKGAFYKETDDKQPLFFTSRFAGQNVELRRTEEKDYVADTTIIDQIVSLVNQGVPEGIAKEMVKRPSATTAATPEED